MWMPMPWMTASLNCRTGVSEKPDPFGALESRAMQRGDDSPKRTQAQAPIVRITVDVPSSHHTLRARPVHNPQ